MSKMNAQNNAQQNQFSWDSEEGFGSFAKSTESTMGVTLSGAKLNGKAYVTCAYLNVPGKGHPVTKTAYMVSKQMIAVMEAQLAWAKANCPKEEIQPKAKPVKRTAPVVDPKDPNFMQAIGQALRDPDFVRMLGSEVVGQMQQAAAKQMAAGRRR